LLVAGIKGGGRIWKREKKWSEKDKGKMIFGNRKRRLNEGRKRLKKARGCFEGLD